MSCRSSRAHISHNGIRRRRRRRNEGSLLAFYTREIDVVLMSRYSTTGLRVMLFCAGKKRISRRFLSVASHSRHCCSSVCTGCMGRKGVKWSVCAVRQKQAGILSLRGKWKVFHRKRVPGISSHAHDRPRFITTYIVQFAMIFSPSSHCGETQSGHSSPGDVRESPTRLRKQSAVVSTNTISPAFFGPNSFRCSLRSPYLFAGKQGAD